MEYWSVDYRSARFSEFSDAQNFSSPVKRQSVNIILRDYKKASIFTCCRKKAFIIYLFTVESFSKEGAPGEKLNCKFDPGSISSRDSRSEKHCP
jgi:hypothetical protein